MVWFTSDTHFGHANVLKFKARPWKTVEEMDGGLVRSINTWVRPEDDLYVLGDFSYKISAEAAAAVRGRIRCRRVHLVPGNHDKDWTDGRVAGAFIVERDVAKLKSGGRKLVLCHYPLMDLPSMSHGSILLHGHIHSTGPAYNDANLAQGIYRMDVGVDANGFRPVSLDEVLRRFEGAPCAGRIGWERWAYVGPEGAEDRSTDAEEGAARRLPGASHLADMPGAGGIVYDPEHGRYLPPYLNDDEEDDGLYDDLAEELLRDE